MAWARFDDRFHSNPKVLGLWQTCPEAVGLYVMCVTYCAMHETDGQVHDWFIQTLAPAKAQRNRMTSALENVGLFLGNESGFLIHDYLDFNPSHEQLEAKRKAQKDRRLRARCEQRDSTLPAREQHGAAAVLYPDPTRPDPSRIKEGQTYVEGSPLEPGGSPHLRVLDGRATSSKEING